jgi:transcription initiation factor TFIIIB Brf1 subunit/transcription initiation factor TFIIB
MNSNSNPNSDSDDTNEFMYFLTNIKKYDNNTCNKNVCNQCNQELYINEGVNECYNCGYEYENVINDSAEYKFDEKNSDQPRCGAVRHPILYDSSYGSVIGFSNYPIYKTMKKLNMWTAQSHNDRTIRSVFHLLTQVGQLNGLSQNIIEFSHRLYYEVINEQTSNIEYTSSRGGYKDGLIASALAHACKEFDVARSVQEIATMFDIDSSDVTKGMNLFNDLMKHSKYLDINKDVLKYTDFVDRYCNMLGLNTDQINSINNICKNVDTLKILSRNTPESMVSGCIFYSSHVYNYNLSKSEIATKCKVSQPTITRIFNILCQYTKELI